MQIQGFLIINLKNETIFSSMLLFSPSNAQRNNSLGYNVNSYFNGNTIFYDLDITLCIQQSPNC